MYKFWAIATLVAGMMVGGCNDGKDSGNGGGKGPAAGETYVSLELSGGHLTEPVEFEGTVDVRPNLFGTSTSVLASGVDLTSSNSDVVLRQFVISLETGESGPYDAAGGDLDVVFFFPSVPTSFSMRPIGGTGGVVLDRGDGDRATVQIHFDASPTQMNGRDQVFRLEGVIDSRK